MFLLLKIIPLTVIFSTLERLIKIIKLTLWGDSFFLLFERMKKFIMQSSCLWSLRSSRLLQWWMMSKRTRKNIHPRKKKTKKISYPSTEWDWCCWNRIVNKNKDRWSNSKAAKRCSEWLLIRTGKSENRKWLKRRRDKIKKERKE